MAMETKRIRVAAAIIHENGRVFATQRGTGEMKDGWEFPGGVARGGSGARDKGGVGHRD